MNKLSSKNCSLNKVLLSNYITMKYINSSKFVLLIVLNLFMSNKVYIFHIRVTIGNWYPLRSKIDLISKLRRTSFFKRVYLSMEDRESV